MHQESNVCSKEIKFIWAKLLTLPRQHMICSKMMNKHTVNYCLFVCVHCRLTTFVPSTELDFTIKVDVQILKLANFDLMNILYFHVHDYTYSLKPKILRNLLQYQETKHIYYLNQKTCELYSRFKNTNMYSM